MKSIVIKLVCIDRQNKKKCVGIHAGSISFISCSIMALFKSTNWLYAVLFGIALLVYANTLSHDYVLDDEVVIVKNQFVNQGIKGIGSIFSEDSFAGYGRVGEGQDVVEGGRYRPLSLAFFALIYSIFGLNPVIYHLLAIMIFAMTCLMLYRVLLIMFKDRSYHIEIAWLTTLLFIVHPVHTEVVANIKGCDEQLALFFGLASLFAVFKWWDQKGIRWMLLSGVFLLLACLAKENAIMLVFIIPLAIFFFRQAGLKDVFRYAAPGFIAAVLFVIIRSSVLEGEHAINRADDPLNNPFLIWNGVSWAPASALSKVATVLYTFGQYVRLMILPYPLTHDYYPFHISLQNFSNPFVLVSLVLLISFLIYGVMSIRRKGIA